MKYHKEVWKLAELMQASPTSVSTCWRDIYNGLLKQKQENVISNYCHSTKLEHTPRNLIRAPRLAHNMPSYKLTANVNVIRKFSLVKPRIHVVNST